MLSQWANTGGSGAGGLGATFVLGAQRTLVPTSSGGSSTPTFTRATTATVVDFEGRLVTVPSGAARFQGARFVQNLVGSSQDLTAVWTLANVSGGASVTATTLTLGNSGSDRLRRTGIWTAGRKYVIRFLASAAAPTTFILKFYDGAEFVSQTVSVTTTPTIFTYSGTASSTYSGGDGIQFVGNAGGNTGLFNLTQIQVEDVTGQSNQNPSEYVSVGVLSAPYHGAGIDGVKYFTTQNGNTVASNVVTEATGAAISSANSKFAVFPNVIGSYFTAPDAAANRITGDIDIQAYARLDDWTPTSAQTLASKYGAAGNISWALQVNASGNLSWFWSSDGTATTNKISTVATSIADGTYGWVRVTFDVDNGATGSDTKFYTSQDGVTWVQLGATVTTAGVTSIFNSTALLGVGGLQSGGGGSPLGGRCSFLKIYNGIAGTLAVNFNANDFTSGTTWTASTTGETWTINGNAKIFGGSGTSSIAAPWDANGPQGYLSEGAGTQILATADIRDMTTVGWTLGATMTRARTSTGIDGVASTATRLTGGAVAATNIITTTITAAATSRTYSAYVKRVTGTGVVRISQDNFATNTDITSQLINGSWVLIQLTQSQLNAVMGFKIDTSTDAIDVDCNQFEALAFASSRMPATGAARNADVLTYASAGNISGTVGTAYLEGFCFASSGVPTALGNSSTDRGIIYNASAAAQHFYDGVNDTTGPAVPAINVLGKYIAAWGGTSVQLANTGSAITTGTFDGDINLDASFAIGLNGNYTTRSWYGTIRNIRIYNRALSAAQLAAMTT